MMMMMMMMMIRHRNNRARNVDRGDVRERMRALPSSEENRIRFIRILRKGVMTAPGMQGSETIFKTMDLFRKIGWEREM